MICGFCRVCVCGSCRVCLTWKEPVGFEGAGRVSLSCDWAAPAVYSFSSSVSFITH